MTVSFNQIGNNIRTPFTFIEFDNSLAVQGPTSQVYKGLIIGQMLSSGTATAKEVVRVTNKDQAASLFGKGSMLHNMFMKWFENNTSTEVFAYPLNDNGSGAKASGSIAVTGTATENGTIILYVAGKRITVAVTKDDANTAIATAIFNAINNASDIPVTSTNGTAGTASLEFDHAGEVGNFTDIRIGYFDDEKSIPAGVTLSITGFSGGSGNPDLSTELAALPEEHYNVIVHPYTDSSNLTEIDSILDDRWGPNKQIEGVAVTSADDTHSNLGTLGDGLNSKFHSIIESHDSPSPVYQWAAGYGAVLAFHAALDPARPFQTLEIKGVYAEEKSKRFTRDERNLLLYDGISTHYVDDGGKVRIERAISTYKTNELGAVDISYLDLNTMFTLSYLRFDFRNTILRKYPRHKLANDGVRIAGGQPIITPTIGKAEAVAKAQQWERQGYIENAESFKDGLIVERNEADPNRMDWVLTPDLMNQLRVNAVKISFLL